MFLSQGTGLGRDCPDCNDALFNKFEDKLSLADGTSVALVNDGRKK
jgi:hypothetical protein